MFEHIIVGCDGSAGARDAVALGARIASVLGSRLSLVGVFPSSLFPIPDKTDRKTLRAEALGTLRRERDLLAPDALIDAIADFSVPHALRHCAERWHAGLVIVGSSQSAPLGHVAIGRFSRQLLYDAPFSLAVASRGLHERDTALRALGVGWDGGAEADAALAAATELARAANAQLLVRRVVEDRVPRLSMEEWMARLDQSHEEMWESAREPALAEAEAAASRLEVQAKVSATVGDPGYEMRALSEPSTSS